MKLIKANTLLFPFLVFSTYVFIILESYFYIGVLRKFILVDSRFLIVFTVFSGFFLIGQKTHFLTSLVFKLNSLIFPLSLIIYLVLLVLESSHFHNYVFSTYHVQPSGLIYMIILSGCLFLINKLISFKKVGYKFSLTKFIVLMIFISIFMEGVAKTVDAAMYSDVYIFTHLNSSYDFKMAERWGVYYDYIKFVKENTEEGSSILIPPQALPWYSTGNVGLDRYFLSPRFLGNGSYDGQIDFGKYDYVMLVWGEWNDAPKERYGWPKERVDAEKIIYFDPATKLTKEKDKDFDPMDTMDGVWGLIKIKK
jgi:hypothetical protein